MTNDAILHSRADVIRATLIGVLAVLIWGPSLPIVRMVADRTGPVGYIGMSCLISGLCGVIKNILDKKKILTSEVLRHPIFYLRWLCFVVNYSLTTLAVNIVSHDNLPLVILLNYSWPTMVIIWSVGLSAVRITHRWAFVLGSVIVMLSLALEIIGPGILNLHRVFMQNDFLAFGIVIISSISWGLFSAMNRKYGHKTGSGGVIPYFQLTFLVGLPFYFSSHATVMPWELPHYLLAILVIFSLCQFLAQKSWYYGMHHGSIVALSLCADFIPWLSLLSAYFFLDAEITTTTIISAFLLVVGAMVTRFGTL